MKTNSKIFYKIKINKMKYYGKTLMKISLIVSNKIQIFQIISLQILKIQVPLVLINKIHNYIISVGTTNDEFYYIQIFF